MGYNPCYCWNLKDGCITIGIWSLTFTLAQMIMFGWQTSVIQLLRNKAANSRLGPNLGIWVPNQPRWPGFYEEYWMNDKETFYMSIFIIQIINLIASFFLLFASVALIYGIYTSSKHLVWPWFSCMAVSIICSMIYCILWWAGNVESYWLVLTVVEFLSVLVNIYCLLCVIVQYNRILKGYTVQDDDEYKPKIVEEYVPRDGYFPEEKTSIAILGSSINFTAAEPFFKENLITYDEEYPPKKPPRYVAQIAPPQNQELTRAYRMRHSIRGDHKPVQSPEFKTRFTEEWIKGVSENGKSEKPISDNDWQQDIKDDRANFYGKTKSLETLNMERQMEGLRTCKSKDSVTNRSRRHCHHHHHHHSHKKKCHHKRSPNDVNDMSSNDDDGDSSDNNIDNDHDYDTVRHARSCSSRRSCRSLNLVKFTDHNSDTGYSATGTSAAGSESEPAADDRSACSRRKKHRRHRCCKHSRAKDLPNEQPRRRPRDVKRADDDRQKRQIQKIVQIGNDFASSDSTPDVRPARPLPPGAIPVLPPGTISIPQNIVIPGATKGQHSSQRQKYHINSEITIRYDRNDDEDEQRRRLQNLHKNQSNMIGANINNSADCCSGLEGQRSTPSTMPVGSTIGSVSNMATRNARGTSSGVSGESKRYASTAV